MSELRYSPLQMISGHSIVVVRNKVTRLRAANIDGDVYVPIGICQLGAGEYAYLRQIVVLCEECGKPYRLADSDSEAVCQKCYDAAGEENERLDRGE